MLFPQALRPGDAVRVIAPSSSFEAPLVWRALGWLSRRYRVRYARGIFARRGYLAGSDERRLAELQQALEEPDVRAVLVARGGYGLSRLAHRVDWSALRARPRWLVGFSDATVLHVEACRQGVASLHACNLTALGRGDAASRAAFLGALEAPERAFGWSGLRVLVPGRARGPLCGGNLTVLHACAASGRLRLPPGCVLLVEDVGERPYRIDRALSTLAAGGHLGRVTGIVAGQFTDCEPGPDGTEVAEVLREALAPLRVPLVTGAPVGHGRRNQPFVVGAAASLLAKGDAGRVEIGG